MAYLRGFGRYLPERIVDNAELAALAGVDPAWIVQASGIEQRRYAAGNESVASLGARAAQDCLRAAEIAPREVGLLIVASGSGERRFPGPAAEIGSTLGIGGVPALDLPMASAGSLFGLSMAAALCRDYGNVLVVGSEIMSRLLRLDHANRDTAILFGDGAGACLVSPRSGFARLADSLLSSDGEFGRELRLDLEGPIRMEGRTIIMQASRKIPRSIGELLERNCIQATDVGIFLMHQANLNLVRRVAAGLGVPESSFYRNMARYGNTSSASMLIAAAEWWSERGGKAIEAPLVFAAFGAGLHWGAALALPPP